MLEGLSRIVLWSVEAGVEAGSQKPDAVSQPQTWASVLVQSDTLVVEKSD